MNELISFGGGVNSVALTILLVNEGWRGPIVFADTGCEWPETYEYLDLFEREWLAPRGLEVTRLRGLPWQRVKKGMSLIEYCEQAHVIPSAHRRWCTIEWKLKAVGRWAEANNVEMQHIGIAADESRRQPNKSRPLCERGITREECLQITAAEGLPLPPRSSCFFCPLQKQAEWRRLWQQHPELYERAVQLEESAVWTKNGRYRATLDPSGKLTLRERRALFEQEAFA